ncbi:DUF4173 domain-containing protein [Chryseobacterium sp. MYb264]|uniref:DUF4153 domain-containing protein n=1 Tax=Chryseobacterium sp. MYb264 TaxID=2745153 RepID=UPI002E100253|nr:DUF4173 domain-containing protein [Chryseobacterium sp. MYb264]
MKTHHYIFLTTLLFTVLFYEENVGLNLGILGVVYACFTLYRTSEKNRTRTFLTLFTTSMLSCIAFAWYGDFPSFLAVVFSLLLLSFMSKNRRMKPLLLIPVFITNFCTFICRFFSFDDWLPKRNMSGIWQKILASILIPSLMLIIFFGIYSAGSDHFASLFRDYEFDLNLWEIICLSAIGFFIAFNYWSYVVEKYIYKQNHLLDNHFQEKDKIQKPTYSFLDLDSERMSGVITFLSLNILLIFFIITFNYEQFYEVSKTPNQLSEETHERVGAVIGSIIMAILVIMFYFKSNFNFDPKAGVMKILAKVWMILNAVLVFSAMAKNTEYIINYGMTYKRVGVYAFLLLSLIGLILTFIKIQKQKKNAYLFNTMMWYFYGTLLLMSYFNWGGMITSYNIERKDFDLNYHTKEFFFNKKQLLEYAEEKHDEKLRKEILQRVEPHKKESFLSKTIYYQTVK